MCFYRSPGQIQSVVKTIYKNIFFDKIYNNFILNLEKSVYREFWRRTFESNNQIQFTHMIW